MSLQPNIRRLFPKYKEVEHAYFKRTGIFPIMHVVGVRRKLVERYSLLPQAIFDAFQRAKSLALEDLQLSFWVPKVSLPWVSADFDETKQVLGPDVWPYGTRANLRTLEKMIRYHKEEGLADREISLDELFPTSAGKE